VRQDVKPEHEPNLSRRQVGIVVHFGYWSCLTTPASGGRGRQ
jgi:hypothetical protein